MSAPVVISFISCVVVLLMQSAFVNGNFRPKAESLQFVTIIHRHGDRNPLTSYANDPHKDYKWPGGLGALSPTGYAKMFALGQHLRQRYSRLLPRDGFYSKENMQIVSTTENRCVMSVQSLLASFMEPSAKMNPLKIAWQPVAVNTLPADRDNILFQILSACPKYDRIFKKLVIDPDPDTDIYKFNQQHSDLLKYISKHSGENITNTLQSIVIHDTLLVQRNNNLKLPAWAESIFPDKMSTLRARGMKLFTETPYMRRIKGGLLITEIADKMIKKQTGELTQNIFIYSAHDLTLVNMLRGLNVTDQTESLPDYGASLIFELHCNGEYSTLNAPCIVKIRYYMNTADENPKLLKIPNCAHPCSLSEFQNSIKDVRIRLTEYAEACKVE